MTSQPRIKSWYDRLDGKRSETLNIVRRCVALAKPALLPPIGQDEQSLLPQTFQSLGSRGMLVLPGKLVLAVFPPALPWLQQEPDPAMEMDPDIDPRLLQDVIQRLFIQDLIVLGELESAGSFDGQGVTGFHTAKRKVMTQIVGTGDSLERINDDLTITVFRRDQYVTKRDSSGSVRCHIVLECIDPMDLPESARSRYSKTDASLDAMEYDEREEDLHTLVEWQPETKTWVVTQELDGQVVNESEEKFSPFVSTVFELSPGEDYGRGLLEANLGDLSSLDSLSEAILDITGQAAKVVPVIDENSQVKETDLTRPTGTPIRGKVREGKVMDIGMLQSGKSADYQLIGDQIDRITARLGPAFLLDSTSVRDSERTTKFEVAEVTLKEVEGALGGVFANIADTNQTGTANYAIHNLRAKNKLKPLPNPGDVRVKAVTGIASLAKRRQAAELMDLVAVAQALGPEAQAYINQGVLFETIVRLRSVSAPGVIRTEEEVRKQIQSALQVQAQQAAQQKAIDVAGNIAEQRAAAMPQ